METPFPNPQTSEFNSTAWATELSAQERDFLDQNFVTFPTAQPNVIFPVSPTVPTLPIATSDTQAASAQFVQNAKNTQVWGALQTFNAGMVASTVDPTTAGGTLLIGHASASNNVEVAAVASRSAILHLGDGDNSTGAVHIGNGTNSSNNVNILNGTGSTGTINLGSATSTTRLGCPLTPNYSYNATTGTGAGKIGEIAVGTLLSQTMVANTPKSIGSITLGVGVWLLYITASGVGNSVFFTMAFSTVTNSITTGLIAIDSSPVSSLSPTQSFAYPVLNLATTTYYAVASIGTSQTLLYTSFTATRIA